MVAVVLETESSESRRCVSFEDNHAAKLTGVLPSVLRGASQIDEHPASDHTILNIVRENLDEGSKLLRLLPINPRGSRSGDRSYLEASVLNLT